VFRDRIELCDVEICSGARRKNARELIVLLAKRDSAGLSGEELAAALQLSGADAAASLVGRVRSQARQSLAEAGIESGREDVIVGGGPGYRLADSISVSVHLDSGHFIENHVPNGDRSNVPNETGQSIGDVPNVHDRQHADVPKVHDETQVDVHNVHDETQVDVHNVHDHQVQESATPETSPSAERRAWILAQLSSGKELRAPDIAKQLNCGTKTVHRDLKSLKAEGRITFVGPRRTGFYRLVEKSDGQADIKPTSS
jgi:biotin operon repressor